MPSGILGLATYNGDDWVQNRRFSLQVLRTLGFGKKSMDEHIQASPKCDMSLFPSHLSLPSERKIAEMYVRYP